MDTGEKKIIISLRLLIGCVHRGEKSYDQEVIEVLSEYKTTTTTRRTTPSKAAQSQPYLYNSLQLQRHAEAVTRKFVGGAGEIMEGLLERGGDDQVNISRRRAGEEG